MKSLFKSYYLNFLISVVSILLAVLLSEGLVRIHHGYVYRTWNPLFEGVLFYDSYIADFARTEHPKYNKLSPSERCKISSADILLSGGSVAASWGLSDSDFLTKRLQEKWNQDVLNLGQPGAILAEEFNNVKDCLSNMENISRVVFLSGYNDVFNIDIHREFLSWKNNNLNHFGFLKHSVLLHKLLRRMYSFPKPRSIDTNLLRILVEKYPKIEFEFWFQPYLTPNKTELSRRERQVLDYSSKELFESAARRKSELLLSLKTISNLKIIDLSNNLNTSKTACFWDLCHLTKEGYVDLVNEVK